MSDPEQRTEWAEHLKDEARAIAKQQVTAGDTHSPVGGPLPYSLDDLAGEVRLAILAERERCAQVAASFAQAEHLVQSFPQATDEERRAAATTARRIAQALRDTGSGGS